MDTPDGFRTTVLSFTREGLGSAEPRLQLALAAKYLDLLRAGDLVPAAITFYTEGVQLVCEGSPLLEALADLERRGCRLLVCTTCLQFLALEDRVRVGTRCGMPDILAAQVAASRVITL